MRCYCLRALQGFMVTLKMEEHSLNSYTSSSVVAIDIVWNFGALV